MLKVNTLSFGQLKNAEHVSLFTNVKVAIDKVTLTAIGLPEALYKSYKQALDLEQDIVNRSMASIYTPEMKAADEERDRLFHLIRLKLQAVTYASPGTELASYATVAKRDFLNKYGTDLCQLPYQEESAVLNGFILDAYNFLGEEAIEAIGITSELEALEAANNSFADMYHERVTEKAGTGTEKTIELRKATEEQFHLVACHIEYKVNSLTTSAETLMCKELLGIINQIITDAQNRLNVRLGKAQDDDQEHVDVVPPVFNK